MIKSMTGYGRGVDSLAGYNITVEIKSVNHRFFEFTPKVYRNYSFIEDKLKTLLQSYISRGKVDCFVQIEPAGETEYAVVEVNYSLAKGYYDAVKELSGRFGLEMNNSVDILTSHPDIFVTRKAAADEETVWQAVKTVALTAVDPFLKMRETEGEKLKTDILSRADTILDCVSFIEQRSPETVKEYNDKLKARVQELIGDNTVDEQRLMNEVAIFADKIAVAEETVRLRSHIDQLRVILEADEPVGRKLDFLVQEMNREGNTIGSKASDIAIAGKVIEIKCEIEKIREQIQNIE